MTLPYAAQGDADGVPVVLLHAYTDSWRSFERVLRHLPPSIRAFAVTQRGHGDADRPDAGYGVEDFAADLAAFVEAVGLEAAVVVGHSSASFTAQRFALDRPERTLGLVLVGAPRSLRDRAEVVRFAEEVAVLRDPIDPGFVRDFQAGTLFRPVPPEFLDLVVAESLKVPARVWRATLAGLLEAVPPAESAVIGAPTLILWGDRDEISPRAEQDALAAAIPGSRLVVYEGTGHSVHWERPERVAADIAAFAERVQARR